MYNHSIKFDASCDPIARSLIKSATEYKHHHRHITVYLLCYTFFVILSPKCPLYIYILL